MLVIIKFTIQAELDAATVISGLNLQTSIKYYHIYNESTASRPHLFYFIYIRNISVGNSLRFQLSDVSLNS
jgi:hypothetical protein